MLSPVDLKSRSQFILEPCLHLISIDRRVGSIVSFPLDDIFRLEREDLPVISLQHDAAILRLDENFTGRSSLFICFAEFDGFHPQ